MTDYSRIRQQISQLRHEEEILLDTLMRPPKMARGRSPGTRIVAV